MEEKTYTLTELVTNLREAQESGLFDRLGISEECAAGTTAVLLGYQITDDGYKQFDADLTAAGL